LLFVFGIILLNVIFVQAAEEFDSNAVEGDAGKILNATSKLKEFGNKEKWEFLAEQWKELLMKNKVFAAINGFFEKISLVFFIFFGMKYEFSPLFFMTVFVWVFHLWLFSSFILEFFPLSKGTKFIAGIGIVMILSHIKYIGFITKLLLSVMLWKEGVWRWIIPIVVIFVVIFIFVFMKLIKKKIKEEEGKRKKEQEKHDRETLHIMAEGVREGVS